MDKKMLIGLLMDGMKYAAGKHRVWISRCFEIQVRPDQVVKLDEYEGFSTEDGISPQRGRRDSDAEDQKGMFHVGRSILHLKNGRVIEQPGAGWGKGGARKKRRAKQTGRRDER